MGTHSDGYVEQELLTTFVTCEGDLSDPQFNTKFARLLKQLQKLLLKDSGQYLGVVKVEPWNSVRVTFTVPKEAALRLRQLAQQRDVTLSQLGILSVQLEGDQAISLRFAGRVSGEAQEIVLRTTPADTESISGQTSVPESDHMISKSVTAPSAGSTASFFRTMTQVLTGTSMNQSLTAFKSPNSSSAFVLPPKVSSSPVASAAATATTIAANTKTTLSHSYHPFITTNSSSATLSSTTAMASVSNSFTNVPSTSGPSTSSYRFSVPPPPYPNTKATTSHLIKSNRAVNEDVSANPSPANVALSSPLLVNLLQNDGGVPVSSSKAAVVDRQKLKTSGTMKSVVPANLVKRKDGAVETFTNMNQLQSADGSATFDGMDAESQIIQRIQKASASEPSTMVTNVRIHGESCSSDSVIVSSGKLPTMNHLTAVTANVQQNYSSQNSHVNMFPRQMSTVASSTLSNQQKVPLSTNLMNNQLITRSTSGHNENQVLAVGQNQKFDLRVINVPSSQHQLLQSQQLLQQQFQQSQPQLLLQQPHQQQLVQQPKSVILPQSTHGAKINASVQELNKFNVNQNTPMVSSLMVAGNRIQFPVNQSLPQASNGTSNSSDSKFDCSLADRNGFADLQGMNVIDQLPVTGIGGMVETASGQISKPDGRSSVQNVINSVVTCSPLQVVKTFTLTNANLSQNSLIPNNLTGSATHMSPKMNSIVYSSGVTSTEKLKSNVSQMISPSVAHSLYSSSPTCYQSTVVTNTSAVSSEPNSYITGNQINDAHSVVFSKSDLNTMSDSDKLFQSTSSFSANQLSTLNSISSGKMTPASASSYTNPTTPLPPYPEKSITSSNGATEEVAKENEEQGSVTGLSQTQSTSGEKEPQFLINPLTGEMEAMPLESSDNESDNQTDIFNSLPPSVANNEDSCFSFTDTMNERSNSVYSDDDDDTVSSSSVKKETDSSDGDAIKNYNGESTISRHRVLSSGSNLSGGTGGEKIKIRLKLEKSEPINNAYKLDVLNTNLKKVDKPTSIVKPMPRVSTSASSTTSVQNATLNSAVEEPRVPPIRLSLRGKSVAFVKKHKKWSDDSKDTVNEDNVDRKLYFNKNKMSPNEVISEKDCVSSDSVELCKSVEGIEDSDEMKSRTTKKKSADTEESQAEGSNDAISSYGPILSSVRTFPTEAEVTSILRSVPSDGHNKMSLSTMKIKKKETKKKTFVRDRTSILSNSVLGDDTADTFTRVINETKCTLSSQSRGKSKSNSSSLLKSVMKSTAAKEARMINLANRNSEKRSVVGENGNSNPKVATAMSSNVQQRRSSADITYTGNTAVFAGVKLNQKASSETFVGSTQQFVPNAQTANNLYGNAHLRDVKKFVANPTGSKKMVNSKTKEYQSSKTEVRKEFHSNHESKKGSHLMKGALDMECKQQNVVINCMQLESNPSVSGISSLPTTNLDLSEKIMKQRLLDDSPLGEPSRKKQRLDNVDTSSKSLSVMDSLLTLPHSNSNNKESEVPIAAAGGESPSGPSSEQTNNQGEDSGIESMDALSEKSPNQGESPCRKDEKDSVVLADPTSNSREKKLAINAYCDKTSIHTMSPQDSIRRDDGESRTPTDVDAELYVKSTRDETCSLEMSEEKTDKGYDRSETVSPDLDDVQPFRVTPALYTYSNPEKIRQDTPSPVLDDITDEIMSPKSMIVENPKTTTSITSTTASTRLKRKRKESIDPIYVTTDKPKGSATSMNRYNNRNNVSLVGKSLLEQLLIDIPSESNVDLRRSGVSTRNTRSQVKGLSQPSPDTLSVCSTSSSSSIRTPKCSPIPRAEEASTKQSPRPASRLTSRRSRKGSESSNISNSDDTTLLGLNKKKSPENGSDLMRACLGFEDHNGKKIAVSALASADCYRTIIGESSAVTTPANSGKTGTARAVGSSTKRATPSIQTDTTTQNTVETRPIGKRRRATNDTPSVRRNLAKTQQDNEGSLIQISGLDESEKSSAPSTPSRGNNRLNTATIKQSSSTPSTSRRSVRQNHVMRRRKSPGSAVDALNTPNSPANSGNSNNNNNSTNKNNNAGRLTGSHNETSKNPFHERGTFVNAEKGENKSSPGKTNNCFTKKDAASLAPSGSVCNNLAEVKSNHGVALGTVAATITTRGHSVKQTHTVNDSAIITPPQDLTHAHTIPASEEVINTRRKTRSIANSNVTSDSEHGNKRRRNSRDGK